MRVHVRGADGDEKLLMKFAWHVKIKGWKHAAVITLREAAWNQSRWNIFVDDFCQCTMDKCQCVQKGIGCGTHCLSGTTCYKFSQPLVLKNINVI